VALLLYVFGTDPGMPVIVKITRCPWAAGLDVGPTSREIVLLTVVIGIGSELCERLMEPHSAAGTQEVDVTTKPAGSGSDIRTALATPGPPLVTVALYVTGAPQVSHVVVSFTFDGLAKLFYVSGSSVGDA